MMKNRVVSVILTVLMLIALPGVTPLLADMLAKKRKAQESVRVSKDGTPVPEKEV